MIQDKYIQKKILLMKELAKEFFKDKVNKIRLINWIEEIILKFLLKH